MDLDEDDCLSPDELFKMILCIEKAFVRETSYVNLESSSLFHELAAKRAERKFFRLMMILEDRDKNNKEGEGGDKTEMEDGIPDGLNDGLITYNEYLVNLKKDISLYKKMVPYNFHLKNVLKNVSYERTIVIGE